MGFFDKDAIIGKLKTIKDAAVESTKKVTNEIKKNNEESKKTDLDVKFILNAAPTFTGDVNVVLGGQFDDEKKNRRNRVEYHARKLLSETNENIRGIF